VPVNPGNNTRLDQALGRHADGLRVEILEDKARAFRSGTSTFTSFADAERAKSQAW